MNPNMKTVLAQSYRANDIQAATDRRRRDAAVAATPEPRDQMAATSMPSTHGLLSVVRRLRPRVA